MGTIQHFAVVAVVGDYNQARAQEAIERVRAFAREQEKREEEMMIGTRFEQLVIGPIPASINGGDTYAFLPDNSKRGWSTADRGNDIREKFIEEFADLGTLMGASDGDNGRFALGDDRTWEFHG